jgi:hypothetical protein
MESQNNNKLDEYIRSLSDKEYQGYMIAKTHLGSSFDLEKSIGFREWKQLQEETVK